MTMHTLNRAGDDELHGAQRVDAMQQDRASVTLAFLAEAGYLDGRQTLLDVVTGTGEDPRMAVVHYGFESAIGLDSHPQTVFDANTLSQFRVPTDSQDRVRFVRADIAMFARDYLGTFDLITANSVTGNMLHSQTLELMVQARELLTPGRGMFAITRKTLNSGDRRSVQGGGQSLELLSEQGGIALHFCEDGLTRRYFDPARTEQLLLEAGFQTMETQIITGQSELGHDCEFAVTIAQ